ncbi:MAG: YqeG family HAD IIIA-type phosphatase [Lachnospiraceae bacterium]|nr:YqeG family HAD IIIA-type phosphatase [Lachnospiraceae bacterium]
MKRNLYPNDYVESTYVIDFEKLYQEGYRGIIFDVDNTLVPHGAPADERAIALFQWLHTLGYRVTLLSNNKEPRVQQFCEQVVGAEYIFKAGKPKPANYRKAMERMGTDADTTIFVGDQIFTDVWGANLAGIRSVLVKPILPWKEEIQIIFKRFIEALILGGYRIYTRYGDTIQPVPLRKES